MTKMKHFEISRFQVCSMENSLFIILIFCFLSLFSVYLPNNNNNNDFIVIIYIIILIIIVIIVIITLIIQFFAIIVMIKIIMMPVSQHF